MVGTISDYGVRRFAREWGYDPNSLAGSDHQQQLIAKRVSEFIDSLIMHPLSVSENGHSVSWSESSHEATGTTDASAIWHHARRRIEQLYWPVLDKGCFELVVICISRPTYSI